MLQTSTTAAEVRQLDGGYARETRALLYQTYLQDPTFAYLFEADRPGFERRVRSTVRQLVNQHFLQDLPALGLFFDDRLAGVALVAPPQRRLGITESWAWQWRMMLGTGVEGTRRYLEYHHAVQECLPSDAVHVLPLMGLHPDFQGPELAEQLLTAVHNWCAQDLTSEGVVLDTGNPRYLAFFERQGYTQIGEVVLGPVVEHVFFHPSPETVGYAQG